MVLNLFSKRKRNARRFRELACPHTKFLYNVALRYTGNTYNAEDMVQETLYIALKKFDQLRDETKCRSWLFSILRSIHLKELRMICRKQEFDKKEGLQYASHLESAAGSFDTEKAFEEKIEKIRLSEIIDGMPEKYKSPILLRFMDDQSYQEISEYLEIPIGTVMSRLSRAKKMLKKEMLRAANKASFTDNVVEFKRIGKGR